MSIWQDFDIKQYSKYGIAQFHALKHIPAMLAFDHLEIIKDAYLNLKEKLYNSNIAQYFLDKYFSLKELQMTYEIILWSKVDTRNFRKLVQKLWLVQDSWKHEEHVQHRPAKLYHFTRKKYL